MDDIPTARYFEEPRYEWWQAIAEGNTYGWSKEALLRLGRDSVIGRYYPYWSVGRLCFSRWTKYPYSYDCPCVVGGGNDFRLWDAKGEEIAAGDLETVVAELKVRLAKMLPPSNEA